MRHLWSFLLSLVLTPLIYIAAGYSAVKFGDASGLDAAAGLGLLGAFVAGGLYALLVMTRLSPVGPVFGGLAYLGVTLWALLDAAGFADVIPADLFGVKGMLHVPVGFGTTLLAAPLLITVFSPRRWRSSPTPVPGAFDAAPAYPSTTASAAPAYPEPLPAAPAYDSAPTLASTPVVPSYESSFPGFEPTTSTSFEPPVYTPPSTPSYGSSSTPWPPPPQREGEERNGLS